MGNHFQWGLASVRAFLYGRPRLFGILTGLLLLFALLMIERFLGHPLAARQLYLLPLWATTRIGGRWAGLLVITVMTVSLTLVDQALGRLNAPRDMLLDGTVHFVTFLGLMFLIHQVEGSLQVAQRYASHDELTGVLNRRAFLHSAKAKVEAAKRQGKDLAVMMVDCDNFKAVNDLYGHAKGDRVLQALAEVLKHESRSGDVVARVGGDEFAILLVDAGPYGTASFHLRIVERFRDAVERLGTPEVSISAGASFAGVDGSTTEQLLDHADQAMYDLKAKSPNRSQTAAS